MTEYQKYLDCEHIWCLITDDDVQPQTCTRCGISTDAWYWVQKYHALEAQRDEAVAACELGGFYDGKPVNGPQLLRDIADGLATFKGMDGAVQVILAKANAEEAAITNLTNDQNCGRM